MNASFSSLIRPEACIFRVIPESCGGPTIDPSFRRFFWRVGSGRVGFWLVISGDVQESVIPHRVHMFAPAPPSLPRPTIPFHTEYLPDVATSHSVCRVTPTILRSILISACAWRVLLIRSSFRSVGRYWLDTGLTGQIPSDYFKSANSGVRKWEFYYLLVRSL